MKISRNWLQTFFEKPLPDARTLADALTFHAFEIESVENDVLDVKVTPNRGHDCLSHRGIAKELSAILELPMKADPLRTSLPAESTGSTIELKIEDTLRAPVAAVAYVKGIKIGPSPAWLKERLEVLGQRSINNVVDATNYVMFDIGMPTHAFDAATFKSDKGVQYGIRTSKKGGQLRLLGGASIELSGEEAVIMNASGEAVDIGGVKGGMLAELNDSTTELVLSASKFHPIHTRKAAQRFNQRTEAAKRFENEMADDLAVYGVHAVANLVREVAGGEIVDIAVERARPSENQTVVVALGKITAALGTMLSVQEVEGVWQRLSMIYHTENDTFTVTPPFERLDLVIPEDLIEEVARIVGYDKVPSTELSPSPKKPEVNAHFYAAEKKREELISQGYSEVFTSVFADEGERVIANKVDGLRPYLRTNLSDGLRMALIKNMPNKDLLGLKQIRIFEIGTVWQGKKELTEVAEFEAEKMSPSTTSFAWKGTDTILEPVVADTYENLPISGTERYQPFSKYPFIVRDIALWVYPEHGRVVPTAEDVLEVIRTHAGELLVRSEKFDEFTKGDKTSYAFRLVFQSFDKTLTDGDANERMESIYDAVKAKGWEVR